jgi:hypothetical protein
MMLRHFSFVLPLSASLALVTSACGSSKSAEPAPASTDSRLIPGFAPPAPKSDEVQIISPALDVEPFSDATYCSYLVNPLPKEVDVVGMISDQSKFGHHITVYDVGPSGKTDDTHKCTDDDMQRARFLGGGGEGSPNVKIPEGLGFRLPAGGHLLVQTHWINTTGDKQRGQAAVNLQYRDPSPDRQIAHTFSAFDSKFEVPPRKQGDATTECKVKKELRLFLLAGHQHEWGSRVSIEQVSGDATKVLYDEKWSPEYNTNPPRLNFTKDEPLVLKEGDTLRLHCEWNNTTEKSLRFPQEMCVAFGMYFPGTADIDCFDGDWQDHTEGK